MVVTIFLTRLNRTGPPNWTSPTVLCKRNAEVKVSYSFQFRRARDSPSVQVVAPPLSLIPRSPIIAHVTSNIPSLSIALVHFLARPWPKLRAFSLPQICAFDFPIWIRASRWRRGTGLWFSEGTEMRWRALGFRRAMQGRRRLRRAQAVVQWSNWSTPRFSIRIDPMLRSALRIRVIQGLSLSPPVWLLRNCRQSKEIRVSIYLAVSFLTTQLRLISWLITVIELSSS